MKKTATPATIIGKDQNCEGGKTVIKHKVSKLTVNRLFLGNGKQGRKGSYNTYGDHNAVWMFKKTGSGSLMI